MFVILKTQIGVEKRGSRAETRDATGKRIRLDGRTHVPERRNSCDNFTKPSLFCEWRLTAERARARASDDASSPAPPFLGRSLRGAEQPLSSFRHRTFHNFVYAFAQSAIV